MLSDIIVIVLKILIVMPFIAPVLIIGFLIWDHIRTERERSIAEYEIRRRELIWERKYRKDTYYGNSRGLFQSKLPSVRYR